jgi:hypothetical protein
VHVLVPEGQLVTSPALLVPSSAAEAALLTQLVKKTASECVPRMQERQQTEARSVTTQWSGQGDLITDVCTATFSHVGPLPWKGLHPHNKIPGPAAAESMTPVL